MNLSEHFTYDELTVTQVRNASNKPNEKQLVNLKKTAQLMEAVRALLGKPIRVNSGFRSYGVNRAVEGSKKILKESKEGNIYCLGEIVHNKTVVDELKKEGIAYRKNLELGIMIETPAAVMISKDLAKEVDFFSVGTNDLTQYTLAIDRQNPQLDDFYDAHHPAILEMIRMAAENAHAQGKWIGICGELGADLEMTEAFLAMGIDELSVSPSAILPLRKRVREIQ